MRKKINNSIYAIAHSYFSLTNVIDKTYIMDLYVEFLEQGTQKWSCYWYIRRKDIYNSWWG